MADLIVDKKDKKKMKGKGKQAVSEKDLVNRQISCICYSKKYYLYFAFTRNFKLIVLNEYLNQVGPDIPLNIRLVQKCMFLDETMELITAGVQGCFIIQLNIQYTYPPRQAIRLNSKGDSTKVEVVPAESGRHTHNGFYKFQKIGQWVKGMTLDLKQGFFVAWNE